MIGGGTVEIAIRGRAAQRAEGGSTASKETGTIAPAGKGRVDSTPAAGLDIDGRMLTQQSQHWGYVM